MTGGRVSAEAFVHMFETLGGARTAKELGVAYRAVRARRKRLERLLNRKISAPETQHPQFRPETFPGRADLQVKNGVVIVAGDAHYWPGPRSLMHRALVHFLNQFRSDRVLRGVVMNGDVTDFSSISRWPQVDWEQRPTVKDEIDVCIDRMMEIAIAAGKVPKFWPLGNHDARWSIMLSSKVPEFANVAGMHLKDSFPLWEPCWSVYINDNTLVKHSYRAGEHATSNNVKASGVNFVTNHLHSAKVVPITNMRGTLWGVDTGCIADIYGKQFLYLQDNPRNWRSAFAVLTYKDGLLLQPELVFQWDKDKVQFRGELVRP